MRVHPRPIEPVVFRCPHRDDSSSGGLHA